MASNPHLPNHLIRELMHIIRRKGNGDAMVHLALSGKEPFSVFRYVIENHGPAYVDRDDVFLLDRLDIVKFLTDGSKRFVVRFVRELRLYDTQYMSLPFGDLEVLTLVDLYSDNFYEFFNKVCDGNISLANLRKLDIRLDFDELLKIMSTTSCFPLPEVVSFEFHFDVVQNLGSLQTFPKVKHLTIVILLDIQMTPALLQQFSYVVKCFTGLETAKLELYYTHSAYQNEFAEVVEFHEWIRNTNFSSPIEFDFMETVLVDYSESPEIIHEQLKSIGFEKTVSAFVRYNEYGNVKLKHRISCYKRFPYNALNDFPYSPISAI